MSHGVTAVTGTFSKSMVLLSHDVTAVTALDIEPAGHSHLSILKSDWR